MFANILSMNISITKLIIFIWMIAIVYMLYLICYDVRFLANLIHAYISMAMEIVKH